MAKRRLVIVVIGLLVMLTAVGGLMAATSSGDPYHPAHYGLPEMIAGHQVVMVVNSDQDPCMLDGHIRFTLQAVEPDMQTFLQNQDNRDMASIYADHPNWEFAFVGPGFDREQAIRLQKEWNELMTAGRCIKHEPIVIITPTP